MMKQLLTGINCYFSDLLFRIKKYIDSPDNDDYLKLCTFFFILSLPLIFGSYLYFTWNFLLDFESGLLLDIYFTGCIPMFTYLMIIVSFIIIYHLSSESIFPILLYINLELLIFFIIFPIKIFTVSNDLNNIFMIRKDKNGEWFIIFLFVTILNSSISIVYIVVATIVNEIYIAKKYIIN